MTTVTNGNLVLVHYKGTLDDGTQFDSSYDRGEPIAFTVGTRQMIPGFDRAVFGMTEGEKKTVQISPVDAYGVSNPEAIKVYTTDSFPEEINLEIGERVEARSEDGQQNFAATITAIEGENVTVDFNHPMAGKNLNFEIELVKINPTN